MEKCDSNIFFTVFLFCLGKKHLKCQYVFTNWVAVAGDHPNCFGHLLTTAGLTHRDTQLDNHSHLVLTILSNISTFPFSILFTHSLFPFGHRYRALQINCISLMPTTKCDLVPFISLVLVWTQTLAPFDKPHTVYSSWVFIFFSSSLPCSLIVYVGFVSVP